MGKYTSHRTVSKMECFNPHLYSFRKLPGLLRNCRNGIICASVTLTLWIKYCIIGIIVIVIVTEENSFSLGILVLSERTPLKLECWVPYAIPYHVLCIPRKPASHRSAWLLHVLLPSRVGLLGTAALAQSRRPDYLVLAPGITFHPSPTADGHCRLSHLLCHHLLHAHFVRDTSNMTVQNPGHSLGSHAADLPSQGNA